MVKQRFENRTDRVQEAVYVFPLPEDSGVDTLRMEVGGKKIIGVIREKEEAQKVYQQAKAAGKKSSLLVQKRPNMFSTKVANIGVGETEGVDLVVVGRAEEGVLGGRYGEVGDGALEVGLDSEGLGELVGLSGLVRALVDAEGAPGAPDNETFGVRYD